MAVQSDAERAFLRAEAAAVGRVEAVLHAVGGDAYDGDAIPHQASVELAGKEIAEGNLGEPLLAIAIVEQELVAAGVRAHVAAVVRLEGLEGRAADAQQLGILRIALHGHARGLQVEQHHAERQRVEDVLAVVHHQQAAAHAAVRIDDDVGEADAPARRERGRRTYAGILAARQQHRADDLCVPGEHRVQRLAPGRHRHIAVDVEADDARARAREGVERLRQHLVGHRPGAQALDVALGDRHQYDRRRFRRRPGPQPDVPVVGGELEAFQRAGGAQPDESGKYEAAHDQYCR